MAARDASEETIRIGYWNITSINSQRNHETGKLVNRQRIISDIMDEENIDIMVCLDSKKPKSGFQEETLNRGYGWGTVGKRTANTRNKKVAFWTGPRTDNAVDDKTSTIVIFKKHFYHDTNRNLEIRLLRHDSVQENNIYIYKLDRVYRRETDRMIRNWKQLDPAGEPNEEEEEEKEEEKEEEGGEDVEESDEDEEELGD